MELYSTMRRVGLDHSVQPALLEGEWRNEGNTTKEVVMPLAVERLTPDSSSVAIREAISRTIQQLIREGKTQEEAAGQAYSMARKATGKSLGKEA